jgi:hypothetical protein
MLPAIRRLQRRMSPMVEAAVEAAVGVVLAY